MSLNRVAIFAHYDKNNEIQDYVVYYLQELLKVAQTIIFVSDSDIQNTELEKVKPYIQKAIIGRHGEYDFGSYKRGFFYVKENNLLSNCDELIFANDSCYAPLFPFEEMFSKMSKLDVDFWGVTENNEKTNSMILPIRHIQSYFIVFKPQVFNSNVFNIFINKIKKEATKENIISKYEIGLTKLLTENNFRFDSYCEITKQTHGAFIHKYKELIKKNKNPFLKRSIALYKNAKLVYPLFLNNLITKHTKYNYKFIMEDQKKNALDAKLEDLIYSNIKYNSSIINKFRKKLISIHLNKREFKIIILGRNIITVNK